MSTEGDTSKTLPSTSKNKTAEQSNDADKTDTTISEGNSNVLVTDDKASTSDEYIRLRVITSDMTNEVHFRVKSATALGRLKRSYCSKLGFQVEELRFIFDGHRIGDEDTPKKLGMMNDDVIEIYQERTGGM